MKKEHIRFEDSATEAFVQAAFEKIESKVKLEAPRFAAINQPPLMGGNMASFIESIHLDSQQLIDKVGTDLPAKALDYQTEQQEKSAETQVRDLQNKSAEPKQRQAETNTLVKNTPYPINIRRLVLAWVAVLIICLSDGLQTRPVYETAGFGNIEATFAALLFACVLAMLAHSYMRIVALGNTVWKQRLIASALAFLIIALFIYMGNIRAEYLSSVVKANVGGDAIQIHFSAIPFVLTSILLFVVAVAICHFYLPTRQQREALSAYQRLHKKKKEIDAEVAQSDMSIRTVESELAELQANREAIKSFGRTLEERIINHAKSCYTLWKHENLFHRQDKGKPDCFDEPYPFTFKSNFLTQND